MNDVASGVLDALARDRPVALVLRHAERPEIPPDPSGHAMALTEQGRLDAAALGARLGNRIRSVRSSPIARCVETATWLGGRAPALDRRLGDLGAFVADIARVWSDWRELGHDAVLARLVSGADLIPGLHPLLATALALARSLLESVGDEVGVHVFVTHDIVLAPLACALLGRPLGRSEWPAFLEPLALAKDERWIEVRYRGERVRVG